MNDLIYLIIIAIILVSLGSWIVWLYNELANHTRETRGYRQMFIRYRRDEQL